MQAESWVRKISKNDRSQNVLRLTPAKSRIPAAAFISGDAPEVSSPPIGSKPIAIRWANGPTTKHFVRSDSNRYMITDRTDAVRDFYLSKGHSVSEVVITAVGEGEFLITPCLSKIDA